MEVKDWLHVGDIRRTDASGDDAQQVRDLLAAKGLSHRREKDVRVDVVCARNDALDSWLTVHVRRVPSEPKPRKKPRRA